MIRSCVLWLIALAITPLAAGFYHSSILLLVVPLTALNTVLVGFTSVSPILLRKRLQIAKVNLFDTAMSFLSSAASILFAYLSSTIWALVFGGLCSSAIKMIGSYFLLPDVRHRFYVSRRFASEILHYGKWIFVSSVIYFLSTNFDRLYLPKVIPLNVFGIYGIASSIAGLLSMLVMQLGQDVLFPFISAHLQLPRPELRMRVAATRLRFLLLSALGFSTFVATADLLVNVLYDARYQAARWMLPVLLMGSWFSMMAHLNEATLLGLGSPSYNAISNGIKLVFIVICLPFSVKMYGLLGGIVVIAAADLCRYLPSVIGLTRERFSFGMQDFFCTGALLFLIALWEWVRLLCGFVTSFDTLPM